MMSGMRENIFSSQERQYLQSEAPNLPSQEFLIDKPAQSETREDESGARYPVHKEEELPQAVQEPPQEEEMEYNATNSKQSKRVTRRGPMDEMRQLVRILVKVIPHSNTNIRACDEGGGGNRISEDQIKHYLQSTLGSAPRPTWGVPDGWGAYLAELFSWVTGRVITKEQAMKCAKREPGRSWEAIDSELTNLGLLPATWPLPLSKESLASALVPAAQAWPSKSNGSGGAKPSSPKRSLESNPSSQLVNNKRARSWEQSSLDMSDEVGLWSEALRLVNAALKLSGSKSTLEEQMTVARLRAEIQSKTQVPSSSIVPQPPALPLFAPAQGPQLVPMQIPGPNGQVQTAYTLHVQQPSQLPASQPLDTASQGGLSQFLLSQPLSQPGGGSSAFQAVRPTSPDKQGSQGSLLDGPPPLRLTKYSPPAAVDSQPGSPSSDEEGNSAVYREPSQSVATSHWSSSPMQNLFKPTALPASSPAAQQFSLAPAQSMYAPQLPVQPMDASRQPHSTWTPTL